MHVLVLAWAFGPCAVAAASPSIEWVAPPECPRQAELAARTQRLIGPQVDSNLTANIHVSGSAAGYRASMKLSTSSGTGARELEDAQCDRLADEVALVLALSAPTSLPARAREPRWTLAAFGGASLGPLAFPAPGAAASLGVEWKLLRIALHGSYYLPQKKQLGDGVLSGRFQLAAAGARAGLPLRFGRLELLPNLGVELYHFSASGRGGVTARTGYATSWGPALGLLARVRFEDHWALAIVSEGVLPLLRPRFLFSDAGPLHQPSLLALSVWMGLEARL
jgi:hypothetical protein